MVYTNTHAFIVQPIRIVGKMIAQAVLATGISWVPSYDLTILA